MKRKLLLVDGHNLFFQMFYGMPSRIVNPGGIAIQGVIGFLGALRKLIRIVAPTHVAVIFDSEGGCERHELLPEYKANRQNFSEIPEEENPFTQLPHVYRALDLIGIRHEEAVGCECDDVIAAYAASTDSEVVISSFDSDYFQLISDRVSVIRYRGESSCLIDKRAVEDRYGVTPALFPDYKSLVGDSSDNIKGVPGIGPKTAKLLLNSYGPLKGIIENPDRVTDTRLREKLLPYFDTLSLNLRLITLIGDCPLSFSFDDLALGDIEFATMDIIRRIGL